VIDRKSFGGSPSSGVTPLCDGLPDPNYSDVIRPEAEAMRALPTTELPAPGVAFEACETFDGDVTEPGICAGCGWLDDEHTVVPAAA